MAVGFLAYSAIKLLRFPLSIQLRFSSCLVLLWLLYLSILPGFFHLLLLLEVSLAILVIKGFLTLMKRRKPINWRNLWLFAFIFIVAGFLSEYGRIHDLPFRRPINFFENFYRFGSIVFGGGSVLITMMFEQYVIRAKTPYVDLLRIF